MTRLDPLRLHADNCEPGRNGCTDATHYRNSLLRSFGHWEAKMLDLVKLTGHTPEGHLADIEDAFRHFRAVALAAALCPCDLDVLQRFIDKARAEDEPEDDR